MKKNELSGAQTKLVYIDTVSDIRGHGTLNRIGSKGIFLTSTDVYFLDLAGTTATLISVIKMNQDPTGYANTFLGIHKDIAWFGIGYAGVEMINIKDISKPRSIGLIKHYGPSIKMAFKDQLVINQSGIFDSSDLLTPMNLKRFDLPVFDLIVKGNCLIYSSSAAQMSLIQSIKLDNAEEFNVSSSLSHKFIDGASSFRDLPDNYLLAASGNGIGIIQIKPPDGKLSLISVIDLEIDPQFFVFDGTSCIARTIPYYGNLLVFYYLDETLKPVRYATLDAEDLLYFSANENYLVYSSFETVGRSKKYLLTALKMNRGALPKLIGSVCAQEFSTFEIIDNALYVFEANGLKFYEFR